MFRSFGDDPEPNDSLWDDETEDHDGFTAMDDSAGDTTSLSDEGWNEDTDEDEAEDDELDEAAEGLELAHIHWRLGNLP